MLAVLLALIPLALVLTLLLMPLWSWLEATLALELVGHSGPAGLCYGLIYALLLALFGLARMMLR
ncbi:hypothetical protein [Marinobacterium sedimentorum]|uniref:hypothetical protein n=1 Tax=Marinobacterium sedimentorum TaxID=2927804 RepID=UPI0020C5FDB4|nr:hypothetical protein [Marinobacterium sedimentorum]MCP8686597.1 hypothetical protein [Marinobacterium sedimentorum]